MAYTGASTKQIDYAASVHPKLVIRIEYIAAEWRKSGCSAEEIEGAERVAAAVRALTDARTILDLARASSDDDDSVVAVALGYEEGPGLGIGKIVTAAAKSLLA